MQNPSSTMHPTPRALLLAALVLPVACDEKPAPTTTTATTTTTTATTTTAPQSPNEALTKQARALTASFAANLKNALMQGMGRGGPAAAVTVCNTEAPTLAAEVEGAEGWSIGRTSLKLRNPHNEPDAWEREQLERFEKAKAAGEPADQLEASTIVESGGSKTFRYMKAIPTAAMCLTCHGSDVASDVEKKLDELYPKDAARGFSVGDLRGAFTLKKPL